MIRYSDFNNLKLIKMTTQSEEAECGESELAMYEALFYCSFAAFMINAVIMLVMLVFLIVKKAQWIASGITFGYLIANVARSFTYTDFIGNSLRDF